MRDDSELRQLIAETKAKYPKAHIPFMVIAPTQRCGTTLLQRMLNAAGDAIVFGENFYMLEQLPAMLGNVVNQYEKKIEVTQATFESYLSSGGGVDATALFPDYIPYSATAISALYELVSLYTEFSLSRGQLSWGIKYQPKNIKGFDNFLQMVDVDKIVFIHRNLLDVAASYKARWPHLMKNNTQMAQFAHRWAQHIHYFLKNNRNLHILSYDELINPLGGGVRGLEAFLDMRLDVNILNYKINSHLKDDVHDQVLVEGGRYITPVVLSAEEKSALISNSEGIFKKLGYA